MTHFDIELVASVHEHVTVEAATADEAIELAKRHSKLSRFSYASPLATQWGAAMATPLLDRDSLTAALAGEGGH